ncbi:hypothetical protein CWR48_16430 [Oceanobacillus arenosus]|uniref:Uncharacterized protein n=1 Tax=Oceanobacillus arenosus TaxID=1229153 RepID=A0A3D8PK64_9BACI|nr:hypothetical protein [Oceanobacillus arenosus]RDW16470.1 hypothetical protein CWR48_16430 [Oceanobacillus arenosus]
MDYHFLSIEEFNALLNQWQGQTIKIIKHELDDLDETLIDLNTISYSTNHRRIDEYEPLHSLRLNGGGAIETETDNFQSLPQSMYEIPLEDYALYEFDGTQFILSTARGVYTIELVSKGME